MSALGEEKEGRGREGKGGEMRGRGTTKKPRRGKKCKGKSEWDGSGVGRGWNGE